MRSTGGVAGAAGAGADLSCGPGPGAGESGNAGISARAICDRGGSIATGGVDKDAVNTGSEELRLPVSNSRQKACRRATELRLTALAFVGVAVVDGALEATGLGVAGVVLEFAEGALELAGGATTAGAATAGAATGGAIDATGVAGFGATSVSASTTGEGERARSAVAALSATTLSAMAVALKPGASAPIIYLPGFKLPTRYEPSGPVVADLMVRVSRFMMVIAALGTTFFDPSLTVPAITPASVCAWRPVTTPKSRKHPVIDLSLMENLIRDISKV
jgi:hypothetical protein